ATKEQWQSLVDFGKKHNILMVNDNPYSFVLGSDPRSILQAEGAREVALELNSLSKTFNMAGWRVGMVLGNAAHIQAVLKVKSNMDSGMFYGIQKGAVAALKSGKAWFEKLDNIYNERREHMFRLASLLGCTYDPEAVGMFVWARLPEGAPRSEEFIDKLLYEKDIFVAPGTIFGEQGEGYIRFSLCVKSEKIEEAIARFKKEK
ncbi:pyridoxal phosphate-dependent aminotransferase, partial [Muriicola sp.]|uniref:pyridoxal phosphate-dependent aminotransferase n=1 Tax=Muriicola sp. TaxID=2020856 RepID=UPI0035667999